ncbi:MAG: DUF748 domain-containing protein [Cryomorphaceae bacterium]
MKKKYKWIAISIVLLIGFRISLPFLLQDRIIRSINDIEGYSGSVGNVDLQIYRGGFKVEELKIFEAASEKPEIPLVNLGLLDFSIQWKALLKGHFVGEVYLDTLLVNFTKRKEDTKSDQDSLDNRIKLIAELQKLNPIQINILEISNSEIFYIDPTTEPEVNVALKEINLRAENLRNVQSSSDDLPASIQVTTSAMDRGMIDLKAEMNYLLEPPDFDIDLEIEQLNLVQFNEFFEAYANLGLKSGTLNFYSEAAARNGQIEGYIKPLIKNLEIADTDSTDGLIKKIYKGAVQAGTELFENQKKDQIGTKVPISGSLEKSQVKILQSLLNFFKNAFIEAYRLEIERSIGFNQAEPATEEASKKQTAK